MGFTLFNEAKEKRPAARTIGNVSQLDLPSAPLFSPLPGPHLAIALTAKSQHDPSQAAASHAEGITASGDPPLDTDSADPSASARASA